MRGEVSEREMELVKKLLGRCGKPIEHLTLTRGYVDLTLEKEQFHKG